MIRKVSKLNSSSNFTLKKTIKIRKYTSKAKKYDVLIVGGGMVGATCALSLANHPLTSSLSIGIIESSDVMSKTVEPLPSVADVRVFAVNHNSVKLFIELGVWDIMKGARVTPYREMKVWDEMGGGSVSFNRDSSSYSELGFIIENHVIQTALNQKIKETNIDVIAPTKIESIVVPENESELWSVIKDVNGNEYSTKLLIGADGGNSMVRKSANIQAHGHSYNKKAIVCTIQLENPTDIAWQRFLNSGPLAILPLYDNYASIVWSTTLQKAEHLLSLNEDDFREQLNYALNDKGKQLDLSETFSTFPLLANGLKKISPHSELPVPPLVVGVASKRFSFPLQYLNAQEYAKPGVVLVGDAAHVIHPLAGQGVNLGFSDAKSLSKVLVEAIDSGSDIGDVTFLKKYEKSRKLKNKSMVMGCHTIEKVFTTENLPFTVGRSVGMSLINKIDPLKTIFTKVADHKY